MQAEKKKEQKEDEGEAPPDENKFDEFMGNDAGARSCFIAAPTGFSEHGVVQAVGLNEVYQVHHLFQLPWAHLINSKQRDR